MNTEKKDHPSVEITKHCCAQAAATEESWERLQQKASVALSPTMNGAAIVEAFAKAPFGAIDALAAISSLNEQLEEIQRGDMSGPEAMLYAQATALQSIFVAYARRACAQEYQRNLEAFMSLALKAQAQCRATLEALNEMKFPKSATFVKQANIANQQQINNGTPARAEKTSISTTELLTEAKHATLDLGGTGETEKLNSQLDAVEAIHGTKNRQREKEERPERP